MIKITPFAALEPYSEAEAASFKTDILDMSLGLNAENSALVAGIPSIMNMGDGELRFVRPLTVMDPAFDEEPELPFLTSPGRFNTVIPGEIPCNAFCREVTGRSASCFGVIVATDPVKFAFFCVP
ncbi:hypothetical protein D3C73_901850 [compost metagenome]